MSDAKIIHFFPYVGYNLNIQFSTLKVHMLQPTTRHTYIFWNFKYYYFSISFPGVTRFDRWSESISRRVRNTFTWNHGYSITSGIYRRFNWYHFGWWSWLWEQRNYCKKKKYFLREINLLYYYYFFLKVHKVIPGTLADRDGRIQKGDRVLSINGRSTKGVTHREALSILKVSLLTINFTGLKIWSKKVLKKLKNLEN